MTNELDELNKKFNDDTYPILPFISKDNVTALTKGLYRKNRAKFRGVTAVYNKDKKEYEFPLYGMYNVVEDYVIVPEGIVLTKEQQNFVDLLLSKGFVQISSMPKFEVFKFSNDTEEAKLALVNKLKYQVNKHSVGDETKENSVFKLAQYGDDYL